MSKAFLMGLNAGRVEDGEDEFDIKELAKHIDGSSTEFVIDGSWGITEIKPYCFYNSLLEDVNLTPITKIGGYAFYNGSELTDFVFNPNILKEVGAYAFYDCKKAFLGKEGNISFEVNLEIVGNYAFNNFALNGKVFDIDFKKKCNFGDYAFRYAKIKKLKGSLGDVGQYAFASLGNGLEEIDVKIEGAIGNYAFATNNTAMLKIDKDSDITALGTYAFQNFGANRSNPSGNRITLDFRKSLFGAIGTYAFSGSSTAVANRPKYYDIFFPSTLTTINTYAFMYGQNFRVFFDSVPTLANVNAFDGASYYSIMAHYLIAPDMKLATNWSSLVANIRGYAQGSEFGIGDLPLYSKASGKPLAWYDDDAMTNQVYQVTDEDEIYIANESGNREVYYLEIYARDTIVEVTNLDDSSVYTSSSFVPIGANLKITNIEAVGDYSVALATINGLDFSLDDEFEMDEDFLIKAISTDGELNLNFNTATPEEIQLASILGFANEYTLGATRTITLKNSQQVVVRIVDNEGDKVRRDDDSYAGLVLEFLDIYENATMNATDYNEGGWYASRMRSETMSTLFALLPDEWQDAIANAKIETMDGGNQAGTVLKTSLDKLWLPAEREIFATIKNSHIDEWEALKRFKLYEDNDVNTFRIKQFNSSNGIWWLRSTYSTLSNYFVRVTSSGNVGGSPASYSSGVAPCFAI